MIVLSDQGFCTVPGFINNTQQTINGQAPGVQNIRMVDRLFQTFRMGMVTLTRWATLVTPPAWPVKVVEAVNAQAVNQNLKLFDILEFKYVHLVEDNMVMFELAQIKRLAMMLAL